VVTILSGGEPLLRNDLEDIVRLTVRIGFHTSSRPTPAF
jgi:molybdenum cofactor biosynthesis enzyme MoaA